MCVFCISAILAVSCRVPTDIATIEIDFEPVPVSL